MSAGGYLLLIFFGAIALLVILLPLLSKRQTARSDFEVEFGKMPLVQQLAQEREAVLQALRDLEFDYQTGKLAQSDYLPQREALLARGAQLLRQLEQERERALEDAIRAARQSKET
ncbi:MAG: hypothetical protein RML95_01450 [Anaerolineae bacterium]|nr:hypothetical protein [Anaerolineae bacterium]MDW8297980.1 hypothetical protein [Anaerolineae bacterium]